MHPHGRWVLHPSRHPLRRLWKPCRCINTHGQNILARIHTHIFVVVDKFTKWIKAKLVTSVTDAMVVEFNSEIMYGFGVPNNIITNNGT
jgi:hypothetical protein